MAAAGGYLDKLAAIYPAPPRSTEPLTRTQREAVTVALAQNDDQKLLNTLLRLRRFPFDDPYVGFLRKRPQEIASSPLTVDRLCRVVRNMSIDDLMGALEAPIPMNRRMGQMFTNWLHSIYRFTAIGDVAAFRNSNDPIVFLNAGGAALRDFANTRGCGLQKEPDFVAKVGRNYVVGEAKFLSTEGGNQNRGIEDALTLASRAATGAVVVAVLDGIVWIPNSGQMSRRLGNYSGNALSALLLDDFLHSL